jgi:plasmid stabilization system protein ParE
MIVVWSKRAVSDLWHICRYIQLHNLAAAARTAGRIESAAAPLPRFPNLGRQGDVPGTREMAVLGLPYVIVYRITVTPVEILRVFHTSRDWPAGMQ